MARAGSLAGTLLPHKIAQAIAIRQRFVTFARANALVYFGLVRPSDDHEAVRGFTAQAGQIDNHTIHGNVLGREVTMLHRSLPDTAPAARTWLIATITHHLPHIPHVLFLSNAHPQAWEEARLIKHHRKEHVALDHRLDALFGIYATPADALESRALVTEPLIKLFTAKREYDYEIDGGAIYVYSHLSRPSVHDLTAQLHTALSLAECLEDGQ